MTPLPLPPVRKEVTSIATVDGATKAATTAAVGSSTNVGAGEVAGGAVRVGAGGMVGGVGSVKTPTYPSMAKVSPTPRVTPPMMPRAMAQGSLLRLADWPADVSSTGVCHGGSEADIGC
jgi:phage tail tape-measure protein